MSDWESPRAQADREKREVRESFDQWADLVERGELTWDTVRALHSELGAAAFVALYPVNPAFQGMGIRKLERSIDGAGDE